MDGTKRPWTRPRRHAARANTPHDRRGTERAGRILFINQYYWPDTASTAQHLADLAESLAERGHECHVLCGQGAYKAGSPPLPRTDFHRGVHIHRAGATSLGRKSTWRRMTDYLSFHASAARACLGLPRFDVVVTLTTPPIIGLLGTLLKTARGSRHVSWSMDLHPDASIALGRMEPGNPVVAAMRWLSDTVSRQADAVVALGPHMARLLAAKGVQPARLKQVPVWSRRDEVYPLPREGHPLRASLGLADKFVAMYSGNLGLAHTFDEFLGAARKLRHRADIVFLFVGGGPRLGEVQKAVGEEHLENIRILDYFPREQLHISLSIADVHLISMRREMTGIVVPGKLYGAMASARPCVFVGPERCESSDTIRQAECGLTISEKDVDGLTKALVTLADDPELRRKLGERGRDAFLESHEREVCCASWAELIQGMLGTKVPAQVRTFVEVAS